MKIFLTFVVLTTLLTLSEQTSIGRRVEEAAVTGNLSVPQSPPADYEHFPGVGYYKFVDQYLTFEDGVAYCEKDGGHLAIINSIEEANALVTLYRKYHDPKLSWPSLGFGDFFGKGTFRTIFGQPISSTGYSYWASPGHPTSPFERNCGDMNIEGQMATHCCDCGRTFFCEIELAICNGSD